MENLDGGKHFGGHRPRVDAHALVGPVRGQPMRVQPQVRQRWNSILPRPQV